MNFEKIRVNSRVKLLGRVKTGNMLITFSVLLRLAVYVLAVLLLLRFNDFYFSNNGRVFLVVCAVVVFFGVILLWCTRTVKDRWYAALSDGCYLNVIDIIVDFSFCDVLNSVGCGLLSSFLSFVRIVAFMCFPSAVAALIWYSVQDGVSKSVFTVLVIGFAAVTVCSAFFLAVTLSCVSLARSLCFCSVHRFKYILRALEKRCFSLFRFSLFPGTLNRCVRRFSKLEFARLVYTFL